MIDIEKLKALLMETKFPFFTDEQLQAICGDSTSMNECMYLLCTMKSKADKIKVGPIEIENDATYWSNLADIYFNKWEKEISGNKPSRSLTGLCVGRSDEY